VPLSYSFFVRDCCCDIAVNNSETELATRLPLAVTYGDKMRYIELWLIHLV